MTVLAGLLGLLLWVMAVIWMRWTVQCWRGQGRPVSARQRTNPLLHDQEALDATDRTVAVDSLMFAGIGTAIICGTVAENVPAQSGPWFLGSGAGFLGFFVSLPLRVLIAHFNRPKFLVPPPFRAEPGARASRRLRARAHRES